MRSYKETPQQAQWRLPESHATSRETPSHGHLPADNRSQAVPSASMQALVDTSPRMVAQRQHMQTLFSQQDTSAEHQPVQRTASASDRSNGLPIGLKQGIESLSGQAMDHVRVHYNSSRPAQMQAHAYAQDSDIHLAPGQEQHLPHEAWHVVQQAQGRVKPTMQMADGQSLNDDVGLEAEADAMGSRAAAVGLASTSSSLSTDVAHPSISEGTSDSAPRQLSIARRDSAASAPVQRVKIKSTEEPKTFVPTSYATLMGIEDFSQAAPVTAYQRRFPEPNALRTLIDDTWKDREFHNIKALTAAINSEIRGAKAEAREKRNEDDAPKIQEKVTRYQSATSEDAWESDWKTFAARMIPLSESLAGIVDARKALLICYRLALVEKFEPEIASAFIRRVVDIGQAFKTRQPYDWHGIAATLSMITSDLQGTPKDYSPFGGARFDAFYGVTKQGGIPLSFLGITSELDAILNVHPSELAEGEVVFSGSKYTDADNAEMTKDVDVSYIDGAGVLHLIENGKDMNTLKNKTSGKQDQKTIYKYLSQKSTSLVHTSKAPLTHTQASRNQITGVQWWYSIPPEALNPRKLSSEDKATLAAVAAAGAGLRSGSARLTRDQLFELSRS
ncbi:hypothetical protein PAN31117_02752 [Pandoraea anapnoica]|uniref:eCIS core domain-containing protein n=1 Tax=Pandoraea anapnoica TaxID=2508301 RepID=A0A5E5A5E8_9BURK|nr:DUF4157 domain-containing protein [Pandoraea anapnoica]VVE67775.1 hypothetical protein PAN31117_02752 [Pandoraea anapnoica]